MNYRETRVIGTTITRITPEDARAYLEKNNDNRNINSKRVDAYANIMRSGGWMETGQPIIVSDSGMLIDGQHRLMAIVRADVPVTMLVVKIMASDGQGELTARNIPLDIGQRRTMTHITGIPSKESSILRFMIWTFENAGQRLSSDPLIVMDRYEKIKQYLCKIPKSTIKDYSSVPIICAFVLSDMRDNDLWEQYTDLINKNYHKLTPIWSSWMRSVDSAKVYKGTEKNIVMLANTWMLTKSSGTKVVVRNIEKEISECTEVYTRMVLK